jgi:hypothetical protein
MPLPEYPPVRVQVPKRAGVGLRFRPRTAEPCWPEDWWQRNCDDVFDVDEPDPCPLTEREQRLPPPP